jgi:hypothetical protein
VLLSEVQNKSEAVPGDRWRAALDGRTLGTSSGTTKGVHRGIDEAGEKRRQP